MNINPNCGGNGRAHRLPKIRTLKPRANGASQAPMAGSKLVVGKGGIIIPEADAIQQAQAEAAKWESKLVSWCPQCGAFEVPAGTECQRRPHPMNAQIPTLWVPCPTCSTPEQPAYHNANFILVPKGVLPPAIDNSQGE
jgi:ribosomal protein L32